METPSVFKPTLPPLLIIIVDASLMIAGSAAPKWLLGMILGASLTWLVVASISVRGNIVRRWPTMRNWFPFLDLSGAIAIEASLQSAHIVGKTFHIADLAHNGRILRKTFDDCVILGPAVIAASGNTHMRDPNWISRSPGGIFFQLQPTHKEGEGVAKDGLVVVEDCTFNRCTFDGVGVAGSDEDSFKKGFAKWSDPPHQPSIN